MYSIKNKQDSENLNELVSLQNQVKALGLQDKLGKQIFLEGMKKNIETATISNKEASEDVTKTMMLNSEGNNKALAYINDKLWEILKDRGK